MEHREPLRIPPADRRLDAAIESPRHGAAIDLRSQSPSIAARARGTRRLIVLSAAGMIILLALVYLASVGTVSAVGWLHRQPYYQLAFDRIRLEPEPPGWYRGGKPAFLEAVRRSARQTKPISRLETAPAEIAALFRNYHWVEEAHVRYPPGGIAVQLRYRRPVAYVQLSQSDQIVVDEKGTILPPADVNESQFEPHRLPRIWGENLPPPADATPGVSWKSPSGTDGIARQDQRIIAAAKLAGYLRDQKRLGSARGLSALRIGEIIVTDFHKRQLWVLNDENQMIWWRNAPGEEAPGEPKADEKWEMLRKWGESAGKRSLPAGDYWAFSPTAIVPVCCCPGHPHSAKAAKGGEIDANSAGNAAGSG